MIRLNKISKQYNEERVLNEFDLTIDNGEFIAIMGRSGAGKTTILNILAGLINVDKGDYYLDKEIVSKMSYKEKSLLRSNKVGYIVQDYALLNDITVKANITICDKLFKRTPNDDYKEIINVLELSRYEEKKVTELSGGQRQRVAIARALYNQPKVLLMDEPTGNLDSETALKVMEYIKKIHTKEKLMIVLVTHDERIAKFADRIITL